MTSASAAVSQTRLQDMAGDLQPPSTLGVELQIDISWSFEDMWVGGFLESSDGSLTEFASSELSFSKAVCDGRRFADVLEGELREGT